MRICSPRAPSRSKSGSPTSGSVPSFVRRGLPVSALAVVPARGGSKGVPGKNLLEVGGRSLVEHAAAVGAGVAGLHLVVSTDDASIHERAQAAGARVIRRPDELAADDTPMAPVLQHAVREFEAQGGSPVDAVVVLQPTAPLRSPADIRKALNLLEMHPEADSVVSVCSLEDLHPGRMYRIGQEGGLDPLWPEWERANRQDLPPVYFRNGAIYVARRRVVMEEGRVIGSRPVAHVMSARWWLNIDDPRDVAIAEPLYHAWRNRPDAASAAEQPERGSGSGSSAASPTS